MDIKTTLKRGCLYTPFESRSIKKRLYIKSWEFERARGRYFFQHMLKFRPAFPDQFLKFVLPFTGSWIEKRLNFSYIVILYETFLNQFEIVVKFLCQWALGMLERDNNEF